MSREDYVVQEIQQHTREIWDAVNALLALQREWTYQDYTNTISGSITLTDSPDVSDIIAVLFTTTDAINGLLIAGHGTNITKIL